MRPLVVKNAIDTWVDEATPTKEFGQTSRLRVRAGASALRRAYLFFNPPWPVGATIVSAKLRVWNSDNWTTSTTLTVDRVTAKWRVNKLNFNNAPAVAGTGVGVTKATAAPDTMWEFDITAMIQAAASSGQWYGLRIVSNNTTGGRLYSSDAPSLTSLPLRPQLIVEWAEAPEEPDSLAPQGNRQVSLQRPTFTYDFNDVFGDAELASHQIQFGSSQALLDAGTTTFDTTEMATSAPMYDSSLTTPAGIWGGLADAATAWWRVRAKDSSLLWSPWSDAVQFGRTTKGTLTITSPTGGAIWEASPVVTWTFIGRTQRAYQVAIAPAASPDDWLWDSGKITSTDLSHTIPFGVIKDTSIAYVVIVRVWDTIDRQATPGDTAYVQAVTASSTIQYDGTVVGITALSMASDALLPIAHLTWTRASGSPLFYQIQRSLDGGTTWEYVDERVGSDLLVSGTSFAYDDTSAPMYQSVQWRVLTIALVSGNPRQSTGSTVSGQVRRIAPFLMEKDGSNAVCFLNPRRERNKAGIQELHQTLDGNMVLVTQSLGKRTGRVGGRLTGEVMTGVTAADMKKRFDKLESKTGQPMVVAVADESINCVAYNFQVEPVTDASGITYEATFDWAEL